MAVMRAVREDLFRQAGVTGDTGVVAGVGLNGVDFADEFAGQLAGVAAALAVPATGIALVNDGIPALWGATDAAAAAIIQHGTGFTAAWRKAPGGEVLFDHLNTGRQFDIRIHLSEAVSRMIDGRLPETPLLAAALAHYGVTDRNEFSALMFRGRIPGDRVRTVIPLVCAAWTAGDPVAGDLVERAVADYARTATALWRSVGTPDAVLALGGGLFRAAGPRFVAMVADRIRTVVPAATVTVPRLPPELGAVLMAAHRCGIPTAPLFARLAAQVNADNAVPAVAATGREDGR
jgi:N-acetylglucosamine kinase-like BadF-type ATPase